MSHDFLSLEGVTRTFGHLVAIDELSLSIDAEEVTAIIGPNGAGKTTLFDLLTGTLKPNEGSIYFRGEEVTDLDSHKIAQLGIARSYQVTNFFPEFTVFENVRLAAQARDARLTPTNVFSHHQRLDRSFDTAEATLERIDLEGVIEQKAETLSYGQQRHLEIGIALASDPELLLLDEPTAGMSPEETTITRRLIDSISESVTIVIVEHDMDVVMNVSDRIAVMNNGRFLAAGSPDEIRNNEDVQKAYLGGSE